MRANFPVSGENVCEADKRGQEVDSPQAKTEGEKQEEEIFSPPVFCFAKASPLVRGGHEKLQTTFVVVGQDM